jgi:hypothetical protein
MRRCGERAAGGLGSGGGGAAPAARHGRVVILVRPPLRPSSSFNPCVLIFS